MTGNELFTRALDLLGLRENDSSLPSDTGDLILRAVSVINITLAEISELDCRIRRVTHEVISINSLDDEIDCSDIVLASVLPYGVARLLMLGEDDSLAAEMKRLYDEARKNALTFGKAEIKPITEVYV